ncbi:cytochrome c oxidase assembly protein [Klugiella xanthotipulae]|uniref:Putative copper resistance protein D n=1 Tax=Klugiella xanthotipulae TaxID=244735 RepID=A0A543I6P1_9MICO|nr:cytochrome c oxidase assembly protein [Klugiella xanthotipulae]TQM66237.1 putative copper resistance protein D [Klugiella xanthotipulae]
MPRLLRVVGPGLLLLSGLIALLISLAVGGAAAPPTSALSSIDPGAAVRYGRPIAGLVVNLSAAVAIGSLVLACFALSPGKKEYDLALDTAAGAAGAYTVSAIAVTILTFLEIAPDVTFGFDDKFGMALGQFVSQIPLGQTWLVVILLASIVTVLCFAVRDQRVLLLVVVVALASLVPMALQGHAAGSAGHDAAVNGLGLHLVAAAVWLGGLVCLAILSPRVEAKRMIILVGRYSSLALLAFIVVAFSGYVSAQLRLGTLESLWGPYGILVLSKVGLLTILGLCGVFQRKFLTGKMSQTPRLRMRYFWVLVASELFFMGAASGVAVALGRTQTPVSQVPASDVDGSQPAQFLTGEPLPPEITGIGSYFTEWRFDPLWTLIVACGIFFYLAGVWRLRKRGDSWPVYRTVLWCLGLLALFYATNGALNVYERYLFSVHMMGHMVLTMAIPVMLVFGAPVTLAARAVKKRQDGSRGVREWILWAVHTPWANVISHPIFAAIMFAGSLWVFYYSGLFRWATTEHLGHQWMLVHFLMSGYLFAQSLVGIDPVKYRLPYPFRLLLLLGTMAFHAFFGLAIMTGTGLMLADWYGAMGRTWGALPLVDQQNGGGIAWSIGEIPTLVLAIMVAVMWSKNDDKESKRTDRNADRTGDADLNEYNAMLEQMAARDQRADERAAARIAAADAASGAAKAGTAVE